MMKLKTAKIILTLLAFAFFYPISIALSQSDTKTGNKFIQDAVSFNGGIFSPADDMVQNIYGTGIAFGGTYKMNVVDNFDLIAGASFIRMTGDPFFDVPDFSTTEDATLTIVPIELTIRITLLQRAKRALSFDAGVDHIWSKQTNPGASSDTGNGPGAHIAFGPEFYLNDNWSIRSYARYLFSSEIKFSGNSNNFELDLSGLMIQASLSWNH